ncbi:DUF4381 family protein [Desulfomarina sp.]
MKRFFVFILLLSGITLSPAASPVSADTLRPLPGPGLQQTGQKRMAATELRDIRGPVPLPAETPWLLYGSAALALLAFSCAFVVFFKKRKKHKAKAPEVTPWNRALAGLKNAEGLKTVQPLQYTEQVSAVLREYVESRFGCKSTRQTSTEFLRALEEQENNAIPSAWYDSLKTCFYLLDLAKFAHRIPAPEDIETIEQSITSFIEQTRPITQKKEGQQ